MSLTAGPILKPLTFWKGVGMIVPRLHATTTRMIHIVRLPSRGNVVYSTMVHKRPVARSADNSTVQHRHVCSEAEFTSNSSILEPEGQTDRRVRADYQVGDTPWPATPAYCSLWRSLQIP